LQGAFTRRPACPWPGGPLKIFVIKRKSSGPEQGEKIKKGKTELFMLNKDSSIEKTLLKRGFLGIFNHKFPFDKEKILL
jgi:hypothetical protein